MNLNNVLGGVVNALGQNNGNNNNGNFNGNNNGNFNGNNGNNGNFNGNNGNNGNFNGNNGNFNGNNNGNFNGNNGNFNGNNNGNFNGNNNGNFDNNGNSQVQNGTNFAGNVKFSVLNELFCKTEGQGGFYAKKGAMVAEQGRFKYEKVLLDPNKSGLVGGVIHHASRKLTGENMEIMKVSGSGACYLADEAQHVTIFDLDMGEKLCVESENLLAFTGDCKYGVCFVGTGVISQRGLFSTKLSSNGPNAQVAVKTDGNPLILTTPCEVDPDAVVAWTGPDPGVKANLSWKMILPGQTSGESYVLTFKESGHQVVVQPSERLSGLRIGIDDKNYQPSTQSSTGMSQAFSGLSNMLGN